jgi:GT2 family glycosyltransferase
LRQKRWSSNDWPAGWTSTDYTPTLRASVVVPAYANQDTLESVLEFLSHQDYPARLFEVVIADDGSSPPLAPRSPAQLDVTITYQDDRGYRLAAARNLGASRARGDVVVFLDSDMLPEPGWLTAHMAPHHRSRWLLVCGFRRHIAADRAPSTDHAASSPSELFQGQEFREPAWIVDYWRDHDQGRVASDDIWRVTSGGNMSITAEAFRELEGFDEDVFSSWGGEDNDFGYRAYQNGVMVVPAPRALAWHLGWGTYASDQIAPLRNLSRTLLAGRIPSRALPSLGGIHPIVPELWLRVDATEMSAMEIIALCGRVLTLDSLGVSIARGDDRGGVDAVLRILDADSRVHVGDHQRAPRPWRNARVTIDTMCSAWIAEELEALRSLISEGGVGEARVIHHDGSTSTARLTRLDSQVDRGLVSPETIFDRFGGRWISQTRLTA